MIRSRTSSPGTSLLGQAFVIVWWRSLAAARGVFHQAVHTVRGRIITVAISLLLPAVIATAASGRVAAFGPTPSGGVPSAALVLAAIAVSSLVPGVLSRLLVLDRDQDPVRCRPAFLGIATGSAAGGIILAASCYLFLFLGLLHGHGMRMDRDSGPVILAWSLLILGGLTMLATVASEVWRRGVVGSNPPRRAEALRRWTVIPFLASFAGLGLVANPPGSPQGTSWVVVGPTWLPWGMGLLSGPATLPLVLIGVAGLLMFVLMPVLLAVLWCQRTPSELGLADIPSPPPTRTVEVPRIPLLEEPGGFRGQLVLLGAKDACDRRWTRSRSAVVLSTILALCGGLWPGGVPEETVVGLALPAVLSVRLLAAFGREQRALRLYIPIMGARRLILLRWVHAFFRVAKGCSLGVTAFLLGAIVAGSPLDPAPLVASAAAGSVVFPTLGVGLGALVPDPAARSIVLPGASRLAILLYGASAVIAIGIATLDGVSVPRPPSNAQLIEAVSAAFAVGGGALFSGLAMADRVWRS